MGIQKWKDHKEFSRSCTAMSVGLGNLWRFPFVAYENGGATFLVSYIVVVFVLGVPLFFLELALGQFSGKNSLKMFRSLAPAFTGIGALQMFATICAASYYCPLLAITLYYLVKSFADTLPWSTCHSEYAEICVDSKNFTENSSLTTSAELFFTNYLLNEPEGIEHGIGTPNWRLVLGIFVTWAGAFFVLTTSMNKSGKIPYSFGWFRYFLLCILLGLALAQKGSREGFSYFLNVEFSQLGNIKVWYHAICQCFFSLGLGFGSIALLASYNPFDGRIHRVALTVPLIVTGTSLLCGFTIFPILGHMANRLHTDVGHVLKSSGIGLLFIAYPEVLSKVTAKPFILAIACFITIYALGFASLITLQQVANTQLVEYLGIQYWLAAAVTSIIGFALGLIYTTPAGMYMIQLVDFFGVAMLLYVGVFLEILCVVFGYGLRNFCKDIEYMTLRKVNIWYRCVWGLVTPLVLVLVFLGYLVTLTKGVELKGIANSKNALICGWILFFFGIVLLLSFGLYHLCKNRNEGCPEMLLSIFNHEHWSPDDEIFVDDWKSSRGLESRSIGDSALVDFFKTIFRR